MLLDFFAEQAALFGQMGALFVFFSLCFVHYQVDTFLILNCCVYEGRPVR